MIATYPGPWSDPPDLHRLVDRNHPLVVALFPEYFHELSSTFCEDRVLICDIAGPFRVIAEKDIVVIWRDFETVNVNNTQHNTSHDADSVCKILQFGLKNSTRYDIYM